MTWRGLSLLVVVVVVVGCGATYEAERPPQNDVTRQELTRVADPPLGAGDSGVVTGRVEVVQTFAPAAPVAYEQVTLYKQEVEVARATTDAHGGFIFIGLNKGGAFEARVHNAAHAGSVRFMLRAAGHLTDLRLVVVNPNNGQ